MNGKGDYHENGPTQGENTHLLCSRRNTSPDQFPRLEIDLFRGRVEPYPPIRGRPLGCPRELALFDFLTRPEPDLSRTRELEVNKVIRDLLEALKRERLVPDWKKRQQTRAAVKRAIAKILGAGLPDICEERIYSSAA